MAERKKWVSFKKGVSQFQLSSANSRCPYLGTFNWKHRDCSIEGFSMPDAEGVRLNAQDISGLRILDVACTLQNEAEFLINSLMHNVPIWSDAL